LSEYTIDSIEVWESYKKVDWEKANCKQVGTNAFYIQDDDDIKKRFARTEYARAICATCPIQFECLVYAFKHERYGMWGAMTARERHFAATNKLGGPSVRDGLAELQRLGVSLFEVVRALKVSQQ
jgi:WhiB family transcriptional regulator, redox-sensing transcriptional regulator